MSLTKGERRALRGLAQLAYERELTSALSEIDTALMEWHGGTIDAFQVNDAIHRYHNGPSKELWSRYQGTKPEISVMVAFARGVLTEDDFPEGQLQMFIEKARLVRREMIEDGGDA